jgi:hypothetical protein
MQERKHAARSVTMPQDFLDCTGVFGQADSGQLQIQRRANVVAARQPITLFERFECTHLQIGLEQEHAAQGHRHGRRTGASSGIQGLREVDAGERVDVWLA